MMLLRSGPATSPFRKAGMAPELMAVVVRRESRLSTAAARSASKTPFMVVICR